MKFKIIKYYRNNQMKVYDYLFYDIFSYNIKISKVTFNNKVLIRTRRISEI